MDKQVIEEDLCTFRICQYGYLSIPESDRTRDQRDHIGRYHKEGEVKFVCEETHKTIIVHRDPEADMQFRCVCLRELVPRSSVKRHYVGCELARKFAADHPLSEVELIPDLNLLASAAKPFRRKKKKLLFPIRTIQQYRVTQHNQPYQDLKRKFQRRRRLSIYIKSYSNMRSPSNDFGKRLISLSRLFKTKQVLVCVSTMCFNMLLRSCVY